MSEARGLTKPNFCTKRQNTTCCMYWYMVEMGFKQTEPHGHVWCCRHAPFLIAFQERAQVFTTVVGQDRMEQREIGVRGGYGWGRQYFVTIHRTTLLQVSTITVSDLDYNPHSSHQTGLLSRSRAYYPEDSRNDHGAYYPEDSRNDHGDSHIDPRDSCNDTGDSRNDHGAYYPEDSRNDHGDSHVDPWDSCNDVGDSRNDTGDSCNDWVAVGKRRKLSKQVLPSCLQTFLLLPLACQHSVTWDCILLHVGIECTEDACMRTQKLSKLHIGCTMSSQDVTNGYNRTMKSASEEGVKCMVMPQASLALSSAIMLLSS